MSPRLPRWRVVLRAGLATFTAILLLCGWRAWSGNMGTVVTGQVYRSGQLSPDRLVERIRSRGVRTVLNLRGPNPDQAWYQAEREAVLKQGATLVDMPLGSDLWLTRDQARTLIDVLQSASRPLWIHCEFGSERTGLAAAFAALLEPGSQLGDGAAQFAPVYLFVPTKDGKIMRAHLEVYERWLAQAGRTHDPDTLREWIRDVYIPRSPSREDWPNDPYPLSVVTRPGEPAQATWSVRQMDPSSKMTRRDPFRIR